MISDFVYPELKTTEKLKFSGENFTIWKLKMEFLLADSKVNYIFADNIDFICRRLILSAVDDLIHVCLTYKTTAKSMMESIDTLVNSPSMNRRRILFRHYKDHRMSEGEHVNRHVFRMRAMARELEMAGVRVSDEIQAVVLLNSLPKSWEDVVGGMIDKEGGLSLDYVSRRLRIAGEVRAWRARDDDTDEDDPNQEDDPNRKSLDAAATYKCLSDFTYSELKTTFRLNYKGTNFNFWVRQLSFITCSYNIDYVLTTPKPSECTDSIALEVYKKWLVDDLTCRHLFLGAMDNDLFLTFHNQPSSKALMENLNAFFNSPSIARRMVLFKKYTSHHMQEGESIHLHIQDMCTMAMVVENAGGEVPDEMQAVALMDSFPDSLEDELTRLSMQMDADGENGLKLNQVRKILCSAASAGYLRPEREEENQGQMSNRRSTKWFKGNCYSCGRLGHHQANCPYQDESVNLSSFR